MTASNERIRQLIWKQYDETDDHEVAPGEIAEELGIDDSEVLVELQRMEDEGTIRVSRVHLQPRTTWPVLVVFANPRDTDPLRLSAEDRAITESVRRAKQRDDIQLMRCHAATVHDLSRGLLDEPFRIVHLSGHGTDGGLVLEDERGCRFVVPQSALAQEFAAYAPPNGYLECVILNACYSLSTGTLTSLGVPYTIAMEGPISDEAAIEFSRGFYDAIGAGKNISFAYGAGCRRVGLAKPGSRFLAKLLRQGESYAAPKGNKPDASDHRTSISASTSS